MISPFTVIAVMVLYLLLLFGIAQYAVRRKQEGRSIVNNPYVYVLSLCVYVTAWTFYGSIGRAVSTGLEFLPIYLGPVLAMTLGWVLIRKMIRVSKEYRLTSIADFISYRYGRSYVIGALVAILCLVMVTPYVALQLIAISLSMDIISGHTTLFGINGLRRLLVAALLAAFAVTFGARQLDPMEHHEGLISVVAFESLVKLLAFLAAGIYVAYGVFGGYGDIVEGIVQSPEYSSIIDIDYVLWFSLTLISFFAVMLLPRQFHVMVVENTEESHLRRAMWLFPLYMLLMNLFVPAIAWGGIILRVPGMEDGFILTIPDSFGQDMLALFVFIGGFSAATAMILVESVAVGTMMLNNLELPYLLDKIGKGRNLSRMLINMRRLNIVLVVLLGYVYSRVVAYDILAEIGVVSFLAVSQLAPAAIGGLYWKKANRVGAMAGLISGLLLWVYTALIPTLAGEGSWLYESVVMGGPLGLSLLKPTALFGLNLDLWSHALFWTMFFNCGLFVLASLLTKPSPDEELHTARFVGVYEKEEELPVERGTIRLGTVDELEATLATYIGKEQAKEQVEANLARLNTTRERIDAQQLLDMWSQFEKTLTASVGSSAAKMIVDDAVPVKPVLEAAEATMPAYALMAGKIYVASDKAYEVFTDQITHGIEGLCITYLDPKEVRRRWGFKETPIIKLSDERGVDHYVSPKNLPLLFMTIKSFVESSRNSIVLIDSIEHLVRANVGVAPERELLDFAYQLEVLGRRTRLVLKERPQFVHRSMSGDVDEIKELIFTLGPLSSYLFQVFSEAMLAGLSDAKKRDVVDEANSLIASGAFFEGAKAASNSCEVKGDEDEHAAACEPDMGSALAAFALNIPPGIVLTRRAFFVAVRRLARVIKKHEPNFDLMTAVGGLMKSYGRSPYEITLLPGTTYVIEEEKPAKSMMLFSELVNHGMEGLCISRYNPETLLERYNIPPETVIWLTQKSEPGYRTVDPTNFPRLSSMISDFLTRASYPVILLEGLGYLITQSNYETVLRFIQSQRDEIALKDAIELVHIDPLSLDTKELHRLESEMEPLKL